jgi:hypothetical protein
MVERLGVEELPPKTPRQSTPRPSNLLEPPPGHWTPPVEPDTGRVSAVIEAFTALGYAFSARALLLLALLGAFVLAVIAATHETTASLYVLIAWCVLTILPIVFLEVRRRRE